MAGHSLIQINEIVISGSGPSGPAEGVLSIGVDDSNEKSVALKLLQSSGPSAGEFLIQEDGGKNILSIGEGSGNSGQLIINPDPNNIDFKVRVVDTTSGMGQYAIDVDTSGPTVGILNVSSQTIPGDVAVFISGSSPGYSMGGTQTGGGRAGLQSQGLDNYGLTLFSGGVVLSGTLYGSKMATTDGSTFYQMMDLCGEGVSIMGMDTRTGAQNSQYPSTAMNKDVFLAISGAFSSPGGSGGRSAKSWGMTDGDAILLGGDTVISGTLFGTSYHSQGSGVWWNRQLQFACDYFRFQDTDQAGSAKTALEWGSHNDAFFYVSGSQSETNAQGGKVSEEGVAVFGGDVVISGSLYAGVPHISTHKASDDTTSRRYVKFNTNGSDSGPGVNNKFVVPYPGKLIKVVGRATSACGSTTISLHKGDEGDLNLDTTSYASIVVDMDTADKNFTFDFTEYYATFLDGEIVGLSMQSATDPGNWDLSAVWEMFVDNKQAY